MAVFCNSKDPAAGELKHVLGGYVGTNTSLTKTDGVWSLRVAGMMVGTSDDWPTFTANTEAYPDATFQVQVKVLASPDW